jgi:hypothetical protein
MHDNALKVVIEPGIHMCDLPPRLFFLILKKIPGAGITVYQIYQKIGQGLFKRIKRNL